MRGVFLCHHAELVQVASHGSFYLYAVSRTFGEPFLYGRYILLCKHARRVYLFGNILSLFIKTAKEGTYCGAVQYLAARKDDTFGVYELAAAYVEDANCARRLSRIPRDDISLRIGRSNDFLLFTKAFYRLYSVAVFRRGFEHEVVRSVLHLFRQRSEKSVCFARKEGCRAVNKFAVFFFRHAAVAHGDTADVSVKTMSDFAYIFWKASVA